MAYTDAQGLAVSTTSSNALAAYEHGIDLFLRWRSGAPEAIQAAVTYDPHFTLGTAPALTWPGAWAGSMSPQRPTDT